MQAGTGGGLMNTTHLLAAAVLGLAIGTAAAGEASGELSISVNVVASCRLQVDGALAFGDVEQDAGSAGARSDISVRCSRNQPYAVAFDYGQHAAGTQRRLSNGAAEVAYQLYADPAQRQPLGPHGSGAELHGTGSGVDQRLPVYAKLTLERSTPLGRYDDTVRLTVIW